MKEKRMDVNFRKRLQRHLYYGDKASLDVPSLPLTELAVDCFHNGTPEKLGHVDLDLASDVIRCNKVSPCSVVLSIMYAKRLRQQKEQNKYLLNTMSSADVFFISMMMASKYLYDEGVEEEVFNDVWADNTDQDVDDINKMEIDFLQAMDWKLFVRPQEFEDTLTAIERRLALQEGLKRGWYTYTEMDMLMNSDTMWMLWSHVGSECSKLLSAISAAYLTSLLSMLGSTALAVHISGHLSSLTMSLLTLQSSSLMLAASSGLSPPMSAMSPLMSVLSPPMSVAPQGDPRETNASELSSTGYDHSEGLKSGTWDLDARWPGRMNHGPTLLQSIGFENNGSESNSTQTADGAKHDRDDSGHVQSSSLWSLWFFDSLVSQVFSVICSKSKLAHCFKWSSSASKKPGSFDRENSADGFSETQTPRFRTRHEGTRTDLRSALKTTGKDTKKNMVVAEVCHTGEARNQATVCSGHSCGYSCLAHPWYPLAQTFSASDCDKSLCLPDFQFCYQVLGHVPDCLNSHRCIGHRSQSKTDKKPDRQTKIVKHAQAEPARETQSSGQDSLKLQTRLSVIPAGFYTNIYNSVLIT